MSHKLTAAGLAAEVARTDFALPEADWNEPPNIPDRCPCCGFDLKADGYPLAHQNDDGNVCEFKPAPRETWAAHDSAQSTRPPLTPQQKVGALDAELRRDDLDSSVRASFIVKRNELANPPRAGHATWGPHDRVEYRPRWTADHHPWTAIGPSGEPNGIRYSNQEVEEDEPEPAPRKVFGWFVPAHIRAVTGEGTITLQCEHGHAEGLPERRLDGPCFGDPHIGVFLRAHAHGATISGYTLPKD